MAGVDFTFCLYILILLLLCQYSCVVQLRSRILFYYYSKNTTKTLVHILLGSHPNRKKTVGPFGYICQENAAAAAEISLQISCCFCVVRRQRKQQQYSIVTIVKTTTVACSSNSILLYTVHCRRNEIVFMLVLSLFSAIGSITPFVVFFGQWAQ